ncbi:MAG TPA: hypothetical protein VMF08_01140 [Candidatus Sulfotelmatobacter sp.]|nr:hypothetical protein [Candidatus Sulfotelmatobacter sp.]
MKRKPAFTLPRPLIAAIIVALSGARAAMAKPIILGPSDPGAVETRK